jgi:hypothetical protein
VRDCDSSDPQYSRLSGIAKFDLMQADQQTGAANSLQTGSEREKNNSSKTSETAVNAEHNQETCNPTRQAYATLIEVSEAFCDA